LKGQGLWHADIAEAFPGSAGAVNVLYGSVAGLTSPGGQFFT